MNSKNDSASLAARASRLQVALIEPEIPPNTGNIARLCAATFTPLHLVGKLGFRTDDKAVRRAGLDYWSEVELHYHLNIEELYEALPECRSCISLPKPSAPTQALGTRRMIVWCLGARLAACLKSCCAQTGSVV
jgi:tRNA (cytidine(34)-2'-O)-methyltransferase